MPIGFLDVIPVLPYRDIRAGHDFLVEVIGLESAGLVEHDGRVIHGEVRVGERRFWLHESSDALTSPDAARVRTAGIVLHVTYLDAHFARVRAAGASILREPTNEDYGQREYAVRDTEGHDWYIATPFTSPVN